MQKDLFNELRTYIDPLKRVIEILRHLYNTTPVPEDVQDVIDQLNPPFYIVLIVHRPAEQEEGIRQILFVSSPSGEPVLPSTRLKRDDMWDRDGRDQELWIRLTKQTGHWFIRQEERKFAYIHLGPKPTMTSKPGRVHAVFTIDEQKVSRKEHVGIWGDIRDLPEGVSEYTRNLLFAFRHQLLVEARYPHLFP